MSIGQYARDKGLNWWKTLQVCRTLLAQQFLHQHQEQAKRQEETATLQKHILEVGNALMGYRASTWTFAMKCTTGNTRDALRVSWIKINIWILGSPLFSFSVTTKNTPGSFKKGDLPCFFFSFVWFDKSTPWIFLWKFLLKNPEVEIRRCAEELQKSHSKVEVEQRERKVRELERWKHNLLSGKI